MLKTRLNISLDQDLADFVKIYAQENRTTASELITQFILGLKRQSQGDSTDIIFSNPEFYRAVKDVQSRLRNGSAEWHTFEEVFGE